MTDDTPPAERQTLTLVFGTRKLTGWRATVVAAVLGAVVGFLIVWLSPARPAETWLAALRDHWPFYASLGLWVIFNVYWTVAAKNAAPVKSAETPGSRQLHVLLMNGSLVLLYLPVHGLRTRFLPNAPVLAPIGLTIQAAFLLLAVSARRSLGRNWSGPVSVVADHQLVRSGPYRWVRHPIYTGMLGMYVGAAVVLGELHSLIAVAILVAIYARKIRMEERTMQGAFGAAYDAYRRDTWTWIPPLW
jgi:protein-S-isoprenylcysteine O-methyltransferase Ste14